MTLIIILWVLPVIILASKRWYHWRYLREVDHSFRAFNNSDDFSRQMMDHGQPAIGGFGLNSGQRALKASLAFLILPVFSKHSAYPHSALAHFYIKVIYAHLTAFYLNLALLISLFVWG